MGVKKADGAHRSRLVAKAAKYINTYNAPELFEATPPIESMKYYLLGSAQDSPSNIMHVDVTRSHFDANSSRDSHVRVPAGDQHEGNSTCVRGSSKPCTALGMQRRIGRSSARRA